MTEEKKKPTNINPKTGKRPGSSGRMRVSIREIEVALRLTAGMQNRAAQKLGISQSSLSERIKKSPKLKEALEDIREEMTSKCEDVLFTKITKERCTASTIFYLKCHGQGRGYIQRHDINANVVISHDDWVKQATAALEAEDTADGK